MGKSATQTLTSERSAHTIGSVSRLAAHLEDSLHQRNLEIASTVKDITVCNLTPISKRRVSQNVEKALAEDSKNQIPDWVKRATAARAARIKEEQNKGKLQESPETKQEPEWVQKAKQAQISRDLRGLDRFLNKKAPALPPEPEWLSKACKRRDLTQLLASSEKVHVSNVETPFWVQSSSALLRTCNCKAQR